MEMKTIGSVAAVMVIFASLSGARAAGIFLHDGAIAVRLSPATGQILSLASADGTAWLASQCDRYDLEGKRSSEARDVVRDVRPLAGAVEFRGANADLGLEVVKRYVISGGILSKQCVYSRQGDRLLLCVSSESRIDPGAYPQGYYFTNIDDGYKVRAVPFLPAREVTIASAWNVSTGSFNFYVPGRNALLVYHRHRLNGRCFFGEADNQIESQYVPGGAITALGQDFVGRGLRCGWRAVACCCGATRGNITITWRPRPLSPITTTASCRPGSNRRGCGSATARRAPAAGWWRTGTRSPATCGRPWPGSAKTNT